MISHQDELWKNIAEEAHAAIVSEPVLSEYFNAAILSHGSLEAALGYNLTDQLCSPVVSAQVIRAAIADALSDDPMIGQRMRSDIRAYFERDPACDRYLMPLLYFKGFQALQLHRIAHWLWRQQRHYFALYLQSQVSEVFAVDIHPAARIGGGIMIDHATGLVVGETAVIEDDVSILHSVTLGGSGCSTGDRHPKIGRGVMIAAGAKILGNIRIGEGVKVGAGSLVLEDVPPHVTVAGVPARIVGRPREESPALEMDQNLLANGGGEDG